MAETSIEWTDFSVNPIRARHRRTGAVGHYCEKYSSGCANCYASGLQWRFKMPEFPGRKTLTTLPVGEAGRVHVNADVDVFLDRSKLDEVLKRQKPTRYFWCDMTDMFGSWVPDAWIDQCFAVMALTPQHTHQVLTKRADRMAAYFGRKHEDFPFGRINDAARPFFREHFDKRKDLQARGWNEGHLVASKPFPNVWLGVSVENQRAADERIPLLLQTPAAVRFLSCEPLLGPVDLTRVKTGHWSYGHVDVMSGYPCGAEPDDMTDFEADPNGWVRKPAGEWDRGPLGIHWVIVGGESGPSARPMDPDWARSIRDQCVAAGVPFFFKQHGTFLRDDPDCFPESFSLMRHEFNLRPKDGYYDVGKKAAGRILDGREWSEFPKTGATS